MCPRRFPSCTGQINQGKRGITRKNRVIPRFLIELRFTFMPDLQLIAIQNVLNKQKSFTVGADNNEPQLFASILERPPPVELLMGPRLEW